jgi:hypothetical protein
MPPVEETLLRRGTGKPLKKNENPRTLKNNDNGQLALPADKGGKKARREKSA